VVGRWAAKEVDAKGKMYLESLKLDFGRFFHVPLRALPTLLTSSTP
jgi:hypothetical protein